MSTSRSKKKRPLHVAGNTGFLPGLPYNVGSNVRTWLASKTRDPKPFSSSTKSLGATTGSATFRSTTSSEDNLSSGQKHPIVGYCGHIPGILHSSKTILGSNFREAADESWREATALHDDTRMSATMGSKRIFLPQKSHRGWAPFESTAKATYVNHFKEQEVFVEPLHYPEDRPLAANKLVGGPPSEPRAVTASPRTHRAEYWLPEESSSATRPPMETLTIIRSKIRSHVGGSGELRLAFYYFTRGGSSISYDQWYSGLKLYGLNYVFRKSEAKAAFDYCDKNRDGKIDWNEFITTTIGRTQRATDNDVAAMHVETGLATAINGIQLD